MHCRRLLLGLLMGISVLCSHGDAAAAYLEDRFDPFVRWNDNTDYYGYGTMDWEAASRAEKETWFEHCGSLDITDEHAYVAAEWVCLHFAVQTYVNFGGYDPEKTLPAVFSDPTWSTPDRFNLPLYYVSISSTGFGHAINGILLGGNPLDFDDWYFFEPQNDQHAFPGDWDMPSGTEVVIVIVRNILEGGIFSGEDVVHWHIEDDLSVSLIEYHEDLVLPEPASFCLLVLGVPFLTRRRRAA